MPNHYRLKLLVAAIGMATASVATAATTKTLHAQNLGAVPVSSLATQPCRLPWAPLSSPEKQMRRCLLWSTNARTLGPPFSTGRGRSKRVTKTEVPMRM